MSKLPGVMSHDPPTELVKKAGEPAAELQSVQAIISHCDGDEVELYDHFLALKKEGKFNKLGLVRNMSVLHDDYTFPVKHIFDFADIFQRGGAGGVVLSHGFLAPDIPIPRKPRRCEQLWGGKLNAEQLKLASVPIPRDIVDKIHTVMRTPETRRAAQEAWDKSVMVYKRFATVADFIRSCRSQEHVECFMNDCNMTKSDVERMFDELDPLVPAGKPGFKRKRGDGEPRLPADLTGFVFLVREVPGINIGGDVTHWMAPLEARGARYICDTNVNQHPVEFSEERPNCCVYATHKCALRDVDPDCCFSWTEISEAVRNMPSVIPRPPTAPPQLRKLSNTVFYFTRAVAAKKFIELAIAADAGVLYYYMETAHGWADLSVAGENVTKFPDNGGMPIKTLKPSNVSANYIVRPSSGMTFPAEEEHLLRMRGISAAKTITEVEFVAMVTNYASALDSIRAEEPQRHAELGKKWSSACTRVAHVKDLARDIPRMSVEMAREAAVLAMEIYASPEYPPREYADRTFAETWDHTCCMEVVHNVLHMIHEKRNHANGERSASERFTGKFRTLKIMQ